MKTTWLPACIAATLLLAGCQSSTDPSPPPTSQDSLTTSSDSGPSTAPPDDMEETSEPADDVAATTEAGGPPQLPAEAEEDSEAGAEAFALHYVDVINYTSRYPETGLIEALGSDGCQSCANRAASVAYSAEHSERMQQDLFAVGESVSLHDPAASTALVRVDIEQIGQDVLNANDEVVDTIDDDEATLVFDLAWDQGWQVEEIQVDVGEQ